MYSLPFVNAFALTGTITMSLILGILMLLMYVFSLLFSSNNTSKPKPRFIFFVFLILFLFVAYISYFFSGLGVPEALNHTIAYSSVIILFFFTTLMVLFRYFSDEEGFISVLRAVKNITVFSCLFSIVEFADINFLHIDIGQFIYRPSIQYFAASALDKIFRIRGFAGESGVHAFMLEALGPITAYYLYVVKKDSGNRIVKHLILALIIVSLIMTVSTAAFLDVGIALAFLFILNVFPILKTLRSNIFRLRTYIMTPIVVVLIYWIEKKVSIGLDIYLSIVGKFNQSYSLVDRQEKLEAFWRAFTNADLLHKLIGYGPSGFRIVGLKDAVISIYATYMLETGVIGLFFFFIYLLILFLLMLRMKGPLRNYLLLAFISSGLHGIFTNEYWNPWFWFLFAIIIHQYQFQRMAGNSTIPENSLDKKVN